MVKLLLFLLGVLLLSCNTGYGHSLPDYSNENSVGKSVNPVIHDATEKSPNKDKHEAVKLLLEGQQSDNQLHPRKRMIVLGALGLWELISILITTGAGVATEEVVRHGHGPDFGLAEEVVTPRPEVVANEEVAFRARVEDLLRTTVPLGMSSSNKTINLKKPGNFTTAREDFNSLGLNNIQNRSHQYQGTTNEVYVGTFGNTTATVRSGSNNRYGSTPTLDIRSGDKVIKIRYVFM